MKQVHIPKAKPKQSDHKLVSYTFSKAINGIKYSVTSKVRIVDLTALAVPVLKEKLAILTARVRLETARRRAKHSELYYGHYQEQQLK
ncbi:hypothetical protein NPIL_303991 [Nephila pilipes]|uniref:Uncharacterized protein n=1 Tax=Nephila pilipes TaxID=299642 RepID=A0A8X6N930_NEPPI|nr:hypothetical protein NPIL_303991 [Nephila pilipes]